MKVICKIDVKGHRGNTKYLRNRVYEVEREYTYGTYEMAGDSCHPMWFIPVKEKVVKCIGASGVAVGGYNVGKEYIAMATLEHKGEVKGYYVVDEKGNIKCMSAKLFTKPHYEEVERFASFTTDELKAEIDRRHKEEEPFKKTWDLYGFTSMSEYEELKKATNILHAFCHKNYNSAVFDANTANLTVGFGKIWGMLAVKLIQKAKETGLSYETTLNEYFVGFDSNKYEIVWKE